MTKPSYEELVTKAAKWLKEQYTEGMCGGKEGIYGYLDYGGVWRWKYPEICATFAKAELNSQSAELARVRGLLQRSFALMNGMGGKHGSLGQMDGWRILFDTLEEALGAESADIGKPDRVDKGNG